VEWESRTGDLGECFKADPSLKSFLVLMENPHNFPARKFVLKAEAKDYAIICDSSDSPNFNLIWVADNCSANTNSGSFLGGSYANNTGLDGRIILTVSDDFTVKEIEVFEIAD
jgi:hypothetical protein